MASPSSPGADTCRLCGVQTLCRAAVGERLVALCPECVALVLADERVARALVAAEGAARFSSAIH
jgi:hypothetical protein